VFDEQIETRIDELLADTRIKNIIVEELSRLCAQKPAAMPIGDYAAAVSNRILVELHDRLHEECSRRGLAEGPPVHTREPVEELDFDRIIHGLMLGMEHDIMVGNLQMVSALGGAIAQRDTGTSEHNDRVTMYAVRLGQRIDLDERQLRALMKGSFVHDIGKIGITDDILLKQGKLTEAERDIMESHVIRGCKIISGVRWLIEARDVVRYHHEKFDGSGYPEHLQGTIIPLNARLFAIADVFDALTSKRPYKPALALEKTLKRMKADSGSHFDPDLLNLFVDMAPALYEEITCCDSIALEAMVLKTVTDVFGVNPATNYLATEEFKKRFGSN
jgi:HD-GYP domain-containing protein (c-di-GMP phosphodiesterase class II)